MMKVVVTYSSKMIKSRFLDTIRIVSTTDLPIHTWNNLVDEQKPYAQKAINAFVGGANEVYLYDENIFPNVIEKKYITEKIIPAIGRIDCRLSKSWIELRGDKRRRTR
jgi:hypothetical protein